MRNSLGYLMIRKLRFSIIFLFFFFSIFQNSFSHLYSQSLNDISSSVDITYTYNSDGDLLAQYVYHLRTNSDISIPIKYFQSNLPFSDIKDLKVKSGDEFMIVSSDKYYDHTRFTSSMQDTIIPFGGEVLIDVTFKKEDHVDDSPSIISLPTKIDGADINKIFVVIPKNFGDPIEADDLAIKSTTQTHIIEILENQSSTFDILFSEKIVFRYEQKNLLTNDTDLESIVEVSIPNQNKGQLLLPGVISISPDNFYVDSEGNSFLQFKVKPSEQKEVVISGYIVVDPRYKDNDISNLSSYTSELNYWEFIDSSAITSQDKSWLDMDQTERNSIISKIGDKVVLDLSPSSTNSQAQRPGSKNLNAQNNSTQQDYVDYSIALLRSRGIPSIQIIGLESIAKINVNIYDTWVSYWDPDNGWTNFDPYRAEINKNSNYTFAKNGSIVFIRRGLNSMSPSLITYNLEELNIESSNTSITPINLIEIESKKLSYNILEKNVPYSVTLKNSGNTIISSYQIKIRKDLLIDRSETIFPGQLKTIDIDIPTSKLEVKDNKAIINLIGTTITNEHISETINIDVDISSFWWWELLSIILSLIIYTFLCTIVITIPKIFSKKKNL